MTVIRLDELRKWLEESKECDDCEVLIGTEAPDGKLYATPVSHVTIMLKERVLVLASKYAVSDS